MQEDGSSISVPGRRDSARDPAIAPRLGAFVVDSRLRFVSFEETGNADRIGERVETLVSGVWLRLLRDAVVQTHRTGGPVVVDGPYGVVWLSRVPEGYHVRFQARDEAGTAPAALVPVGTDATIGFAPPDPDRMAWTVYAQAPVVLCALTVPDGRILVPNAAWFSVLGFAPEEVEGRSLLDHVLLEDQETVVAALARPLSDPNERRFIARFKTARGELRHLEWTARAEDSYLNAVAHDVTAARMAAAAMRREVYRDPLTGLHNRRYIEDQLVAVTGEGADAPSALLFIDLDRFKSINDACGHEVGDAVLRVVARRLESTLRGEDVVSRLGGDEFLALLPRIAAPGDAAIVARKLIDALREPCRIDGHELVVMASVGIAIAPMHGRNPQELVRKADAAMYSAKREGRGGYAVWEETPGGNLDPMDRLRFESRLGQAVENGELVLHYQPQYAADGTTLRGFEALMRWQPDGAEMIPAGTFLPLAEEMGLLIPMGDWAFGAACRQASQWSQTDDRFVMSVNLSARQLADPHLVDKVRRTLDETKVPANRMELELTETVLAKGDDQVRSTLAALRDLGVRLSVDDFGTGYANFAYLANLRLDRLKIDRSLVGNVDNSEQDQAVVRAVVDLAHTLGMEVVAEGVETRAQYEHLVSMGCDIIQGYYFSKPLPPAELHRQLGAGPSGTA